MATIEKEKALDVVRQMVADGQVSQEVAEKYFPELKESKESEDERIKGAAIEFVRQNKSFNYRLGISKEEVIAWLEKQGEQKLIDKIQLGKKYKCIASPRYSAFMKGEIYKPEDKFLCSLMNFCYDCFEPIEDGDHKPADKVEPKFHEGEWVVYECGEETATLQITRIVGKTYVFSDDSTLGVVDEDTLRLWDITKDAKDGDVLADGNLPFIFKKIDTNKYSYAYCGISVDDGFKIESDGESGEWTWMQDIKPATKEQRDTLMKAMSDAGYTFDFEKKELKKIELRPYQWNISDFRTWQYIVSDVLTKHDGIGQYLDDGLCKKIAQDMQDEWSKKLCPVQHPTEWSKEDEAHIDSLLKRLGGISKPGAAFISTRFAISEDKDWLKSLRPQKWRPTEDQIMCLQDAISNYQHRGYKAETLETLLKQLKQL